MTFPRSRFLGGDLRGVPRLCLTIAFAALVTIPAVAAAQSPSIEVTGGTTATVPGTYASGTYSSIAVSGTGDGGERSTLSINEAIELDGFQSLSVTTGGLLTINANLTTAGAYGLYTTGSVGDGGTLSLASGTLSVGSLSLSGSGAFQRTGGSYSIGDLSLSQGVAVGFHEGDRIGAGGHSYLDILSGARFVLNTNLVGGTSAIEVYLSGSDSALVRSTGTETINVAGIAVAGGASFRLIEGDVIDGASVGEFNGSAPSGPSTLTLAPGTTSLKLSWLALGRNGTIEDLSSIPYDVRGLSVAGQRVEYRDGTISDTITESLDISGSGTVALQKDLTLTGQYAGLSLSGSGSSLELNGHAVSTPGLWLYDGASLTPTEDISVSSSIGVYSQTAGTPTVLMLTQNLVLSANGNRPPSIDVSGAGARIERASPGLTITATGATVSVSSGSFTMEAGDTFTGSTVSVWGGTVSNAGAQTLAALNVGGLNSDTGMPATYAADAPLVISGSTTDLMVWGGGVFRANANVTVGTADVWNGGLQILSGTFTVTDFLQVSGTGGFTVNRDGGAAYDIASLTLLNQAKLDFDAATDRIGSLSVASGAIFTTGTTGGGLVLDSLSIASAIDSPQAHLLLGSFGGVSGPGSWGLRMPDAFSSQLESWINDGSIVALSGESLNVVQEGGYAYVVPEPASIAMAVSGIAAAAAILRRRPRDKKQPAE